jgi:hypothetical protein
MVLLMMAFENSTHEGTLCPFRLRNRAAACAEEVSFGQLFIKVLEKHIVLKQIMTIEDWRCAHHTPASPYLDQLILIWRKRSLPLRKPASRLRCGTKGTVRLKNMPSG